MARTAEVSLLHPIMRAPVLQLRDLLEDDYQQNRTLTWFRPFETYRSPEDQDALHLKGTTKARAWQSAHQWGLAADFVPWVSGNWSWSSDHDYAHLKQRAKLLGLDVPIAWDQVHVEHPKWGLRRTIFR